MPVGPNVIWVFWLSARKKLVFMEFRESRETGGNWKQIWRVQLFFISWQRIFWPWCRFFVFLSSHLSCVCCSPFLFLLNSFSFRSFFYLCFLTFIFFVSCSFYSTQFCSTLSCRPPFSLCSVLFLKYLFFRQTKYKNLTILFQLVH
jgi:hypothetical protein